MAYPTQDFVHQAEQIALLTDHYRAATNVNGILNALAPSVQAIENMFWSIINSFLLANSPTGDQLNSLGSIVGAQRGYLNDADYLAAVLLQIRVNRSQGLSEDIIDISTLSGSTPSYLDYPTECAFLVENLNLPSPLVTANMLTQARSVGIYGVMHYSTWPNGGNFKFVSRYGGASDEGGWSSRYGGATNAGLMVAGVAL